MSSIQKLLVALGVVAVAAIAWVATGIGNPAPSAEPAIVVRDAWVKAVPDLAVDGDMTGAFMVLENTTDEDIFVTGGTDNSGYTMMPLEAHEVVANDAGEMVMQPAEGGILIPAGDMVQLMPGGFHIMYMMMTKPIAVGDDVSFTLTLSNGDTLDVTAVAMTLEGGQERYVQK